MYQVEMISLDELVPASHNYRKFKKIWNLKSVGKQLRKLEKDNPYKGYGLPHLFKCLLLQFMEDLSDRELERYIQENTAAKWFCEFSLSEKTPDFTVYCEFRKRLGTKFLSKVFAELRDQLKAQGLMNEVLPEVATDKQARIGCKGKNKFWFGYKKHTSVDMQSGLINKVAVTPANVLDPKGMKHVCSAAL